MLAALGQFYHWSRAELEALNFREMWFWLACRNRYFEQVNADD
jgi:hypothetical protein